MKTTVLQKVICKKSFYEYFLWSWDIRHYDLPLIDSWHIKYFCDEVQDFMENDEMSRMSIECPPRILKSEIVNIALSEWLSIISNGTMSVMTYSANQSLSSTLNVKKRDVIKSLEFQTMFNLKIKDDLDTQNEFAFLNGGILRGGSVSSGQIGKGSDVIIYDDLLDYKTAAMEVGRQSAYDLYENTQTRFNNPNKKKIIIINQRLHVNDLIGYLSEKGTLEKFDKRIVLPALDEDGDPTMPNILSKESLNELKISLGKEKFNAQYLQDPQESGSLVFDKHAFKYNDYINVRDHYGITFIDVADDGDDSIAMAFAKRSDGVWNIPDVFFETGMIEETIPLIANRIKDLGIDDVIVEKNNGGKGFAILLVDQLERIEYYPNVVTKHTTTNKYVRISTNQGNIQQHFYFNNIRSNSYDKFLKEVFDYTYNAKHDDAPDCLACLIENIINNKLL